MIVMVSLIERGFNQELAISGRTLKNLRSGLMVVATINRTGEMNLAETIGIDPRCDAIMEYQKSNASEILMTDNLQDMDSGEKWRVGRIRLDCPPYSLKRELVEISPKDQT
ncbi:MAG: hypothetical protein KGL39_33590 [Patescibacteria group bacterium]|nr:hypothetical protein [Patescibacteria group bacterium]